MPLAGFTTMALIDKIKDISSGFLGQSPWHE
jgi:hypothetical protein